MRTYLLVGFCLVQAALYESRADDLDSQLPFDDVPELEIPPLFAPDEIVPGVVYCAEFGVDYQPGVESILSRLNLARFWIEVTF